jgi:hypothetical protein
MMMMKECWRHQDDAQVEEVVEVEVAEAALLAPFHSVVAGKVVPQRKVTTLWKGTSQWNLVLLRTRLQKIQRNAHVTWLQMQVGLVAEEEGLKALLLDGGLSSEKGKWDTVSCLMVHL